MLKCIIIALVHAVSQLPVLDTQHNVFKSDYEHEKISAMILFFYRYLRQSYTYNFILLNIPPGKKVELYWIRTY